MKVCIVSGNPKKDGLCQSVIDDVKTGAAFGGAQVEEVRLCDYKLLKCQVCGQGWGRCRNEHICILGNDGFDDIREKIKASDVIVFATPVYWGETTETFKSFIDRLRRCEFNGGDTLKGKQALLIASAGGTGNGLLTALEQMDRFCRHTGMVIFDYFGINRWNSDYKKAAVKAAACALAGGRKNGDKV